MEGHYICQAGIFAGEAVLPQITFLSTMCHKKPYIFIFFWPYFSHLYGYESRSEEGFGTVAVCNHDNNTEIQSLSCSITE